jgi:small-conductance mechanosensitive channel
LTDQSNGLSSAAYSWMGKTTKQLGQGCGLLVLSTFFLGLLVFIVGMVSDGLDAHLIKFEAEPVEGWNYWRWFYFKRNLGGITITAIVLAVIGCLVTWGWIRLVKAVLGDKNPNLDKS